MAESKVKKLRVMLENIFRKYFSAQNDFLKNNKEIETIVEMRVISYVGSGGKCRMKEIAESLAVSKNNLTNVVNKLVNKKILKRSRSTDDRRAVFVELTAKGTRLFEKEEEMFLQFSKELLDSVSKKEQNILIDILNKIEQL